MATNQAYLKYKENSIFSAPPEELTLMLYNGLIRFITQAQKALDDNDPSKAHNDIIRAENIIIEFQSTLDQSFEISKSMMLLYDYMYRRLVEANIKKDRQILDEVLDLAVQFRDTWAQAMKLAKSQPRMAEIAK